MLYAFYLCVLFGTILFDFASLRENKVEVFRTRFVKSKLCMPSEFYLYLLCTKLISARKIHFM